MTDVSKAEALILEQMRILPSARFPINEVIGSVLREDVLAERDHPPYVVIVLLGRKAQVFNHFQLLKKQNV